MTREEKARELAIKCSKTTDDNGNEVYNAFCEAALQEMAAWKEQQMIEKTAEWLERNIKEYIDSDIYDNIIIDRKLYEDFRKAMEE